jgi:hypothetical protein
MVIRRISDLFSQDEVGTFCPQFNFFRNKLSSLRIPFDRIAFQILSNWYGYSFFIKLSIFFFLLLCGNDIKLQLLLIYFIFVLIALLFM